MATVCVESELISWPWPSPEPFRPSDSRIDSHTTSTARIRRFK